jgi:signal transduction histidine kinase
MNFHPSLRTLLFMAFTLVAAVPVLMLAFWEQRTALDHEIATVNEKHLLLAKHIAGTFERYSSDVEMAFKSTTTDHGHVDPQHMGDMLSGVGFRHIYTLDNQGRARTVLCGLDCPVGKPFPPKIFAKLKEVLTQASKTPGAVFSSVLIKNAKNQPTFYYVRTTMAGDFKVGELGTEYIVKIQQSVSFGEKGHAAVVDKKGQLIAHPLPTWVAEMKDISKLSVVKLMMAGKTGVVKFYSPALKAEMIAGYTSVPSSKWGVMIPQPFQELVDKSNELRNIVFAITAFGIAISIIFGWWLSGKLAHPLRVVADTANAAAERDLTIRAEVYNQLQPREITQLTRSFNVMMEQIHIKNQELETISEKANAANNAKSVFLSSMSHELRTPMNAVLGWAQLLLMDPKQPLTESQVRGVQQILDGSSHLLDLINQILDLSLIESGKYDLHPEHLWPAEVFKECFEYIKPMAEPREISLSGNKGENEGIFVDRARLKQSLLNLISNAVKYNNDGGSVNFGCSTTADGNVRLFVTDNGRGIAPQYQNQIFQPFNRLGKENSDIEGSGIGLTITKSLVDAMGGQIGFESELGKGSTSWLEFPEISKEQADKLANL